MTSLVIKSNIRKKVAELQGPNPEITSVADEVEREIEHKVEDMLRDALKRAKDNHRRTLHSRDL